MHKKIMLLGSGELGKEFVIAAKRLGHYVIAVDSYDNAPAQQVADTREVINMLDGDALDAIVAKHNPDFIVPEIEAIRTERFYSYESQGITVVPSAKAANFTMNRKAIRDLAARELKLRTAKFEYANTLETFSSAVHRIGIPCVVKPLMSSSGKGQSVVRSESEIEKAWQYAIEGSRGDVMEVIIEEFIPFDSEITLLTITQKSGETLFCPPIGHRQERGDYRESWMPHPMKEEDILEAQRMAAQVTKALGGEGIWGVEFFLTKNGVYFSELSPRPHDTGMVTLAPVLPLNEFELHLRAILGLPIPDLKLQHIAASAVVLASDEGIPVIHGIDIALQKNNVDVKVFGKPTKRPYRRMAVALAWANENTNVNEVVQLAKETAACISVH